MLVKFRLSSIINIRLGDIMKRNGSLLFITICLLTASCGGGGGGSSSSSVGSSSAPGAGTGSNTGSGSGTGSGTGSTGSSSINPADYVIPSKVEAIKVE